LFARVGGLETHADRSTSWSTAKDVIQVTGVRESPVT
jgi:hypothetical protein